MGDVLNGYQKVQNGTLDVMLHEWALHLNTSLESLSFQIVGTSMMMHSHGLEIFVYVHVICAIFQQTINNVQRHCFEGETKANDELKKCFLA
jgi:hypothetical protein